MTPQEHLVAARAKIAQGWCRQNMALTHDNWTCAASSPRAVRWCSLGALAAAMPQHLGLGMLHTTPGYAVLMAAMGITPSTSSSSNHNAISTWNDDSQRTHAEVVAVFDRAVTLAEAQSN